MDREYKFDINDYTIEKRMENMDYNGEVYKARSTEGRFYLIKFGKKEALRYEVKPEL